MKRIFIMLLTFVIAWFLLSWAFKGLYHVEIFIKPYTEAGKIILYWTQQVFAFLIALVGSYIFAFKDIK